MQWLWDRPPLKRLRLTISMAQWSVRLPAILALVATQVRIPLEGLGFRVWLTILMAQWSVRLPAILALVATQVSPWKIILASTSAQIGTRSASHRGLGGHAGETASGAFPECGARNCQHGIMALVATQFRLPLGESLQAPVHGLAPESASMAPLPC